MGLSEIIIQRINDEGPVSFRDFMEMCLYYPGTGYYTSLHDKIGKDGDYYTSSYLSSLFGALIGKKLEEMWSRMGNQKFTVVEYGAGTGMLCHDILDYLQYNPEFYSCLDYCIIEKSPAMREKEKNHLAGKGIVSWYDSIRDISPVTGCILSNEVLDNFSVHRVVMEEELMEIFVGYENDFFEILRPAGEGLLNYTKELNLSLPKGFRAEINLEAIEWIKEIADCLQQGYVLTIDYGYPSSELYRDCRKNGTLMYYYRHTINDQPYSNIGKQDITSHINFSALSHWGLKKGLITDELTSQAEFMLSLGWDERLREVLLQGPDPYLNFKRYASLKYMFLADIGRKFHVLIQHKGILQKNRRPKTGLFNTKYIRDILI